MIDLDVIQFRIENQKLSKGHISNVQDIVAWFGAMQAQDFYGAKWAVAQRTNGQTDAGIEQAFTNGDILRTHIMRPTWHFVSPLDIRWLIKVTAPNVYAYNRSYYKKYGFDETVFSKSNAVIQKTLEKSTYATRSDLSGALHDAKLPSSGISLIFLIMQAELDGIVCSGPRIGKQFTYALLDKRAPKGQEFTIDEALMELAKRYFQSHGPSQIRDFAWWSGLKMLDAKKALHFLGSNIEKVKIDEKIYWFLPRAHSIQNQVNNVFLLPGFDEYVIAYADRSLILDQKDAVHMKLGGILLTGFVVKNGKIAGGWKRSIKKNVVSITINYFEKITPEYYEKIKLEATRYGQFLGLPVELH